MKHNKSFLYSFWISLAILDLLSHTTTASTKSHISTLSADHKVDKSIQLFENDQSATIKCSFQQNLSAPSAATSVEWLKYDSADRKLLQIYPASAGNSTTSELTLTITDKSDFIDAQALYVCKLKNTGLNDSLFNTQYTQEIHSNGKKI